MPLGDRDHQPQVAADEEVLDLLSLLEQLFEQFQVGRLRVLAVDPVT